MRNRGISTVADVALCVLLVGAGVATLSAATPPPDQSGVDPTPVATVLAASTNTTATTGDPRGTIAEAVAGAALAMARTPDEPSAQHAQLPRVNDTLDQLVGPVHITAVWRPYPNAPVDGEVTVGPTPPPTTPVNTVRVTVPLAPTVPPQTARATARRGGYAALAQQLAAATLTRIRQPCTGSATVRTAPCTDPDTPVVDPAAVDALATQYVGDLRARYATPMAAAHAVLVDEVTVIVRRWDR